jgi:hypothetical protein
MRHSGSIALRQADWAFRAQTKFPLNLTYLKRTPREEPGVLGLEFRRSCARLGTHESLGLPGFLLFCGV